MTVLPRPCVLDASAGIKLFLPEDYSDEVQWLFDQARAAREHSFRVPDLFFVECANVLWKKVRRGEYAEHNALGDLADLRAMRLPTTPTDTLMVRALELACGYGITAYDACYAALAEALDLPLLTADARLAGLLSTSGIQIVVLGE